MSALPPNDPNQNPFTHQEVERWRKGHKPLPMSRDPDRERRHRRQSLIQDAIARVRATQHAYNAPDPPSKRADESAIRPRGSFGAENFAWDLIRLPHQLFQDSDGTFMGLGSSGLRSNHNGPFMDTVVMRSNGFRETTKQESHLNAQYGSGGLSEIHSTMSNTTVDAGLLGQPIRQVTPAETLPVNWLGYFVNTLQSQSVTGEFEDAVEGWEEQARKRFRRERR